MGTNLFIRSFIHSFIQAISIVPLQATTTQRRSRHNTDTVPEFHAEAPQATVSEGLAQGPYVAARAGVEPMTLRTKGLDSTNAPPTPHNIDIIHGSIRMSRVVPLNQNSAPLFLLSVQLWNGFPIILRHQGRTRKKCQRDLIFRGDGL